MTKLLPTGTFVFYEKENWLGLLHNKEYHDFVLVTYQSDRNSELIEFTDSDEDTYEYPSWVCAKEYRKGATPFKKFFVPPELI